MTVNVFELPLPPEIKSVCVAPVYSVRDRDDDHVTARINDMFALWFWADIEWRHENGRWIVSYWKGCVKP